MSTNAPVRKPRAAHLGPDRRRPLVLDTALRIAVEDGIGSVSIAFDTGLTSRDAA